MIIELLLSGFFKIMDTLVAVDIPDLPPEAMEYVNIAFDYMVGAVGIVANYVPLDYFLTLFGIILAVDVGVMLYHLVIWIIKKIPMLGME